MTRERHTDPVKIPGYAAEEDANLPSTPSPLRTAGQDEAQNRGTRAPKEGSGVVVGSGAGDGGGGTAEDYDSDAASGSQTLG